MAFASRSSAIVAIIGNMTSQLPELRSAEKRAKLRAKDFRPVEPDANAAFAEERIVFLRDGQIGQRLVAAHVQRPNDQRPIRANGQGDRLVLVKLLVFAGSAQRAP